MLYIVPTPIGNLEDITLRAINVLKEVDIVFAEDTRTSGGLLKHLNIQKSIMAYHMHNEHAIVNNIVQKLQEGKKIALISDAGTPAISDPGYLLVKACADNNLPITCLPGATAFVPALVASALPADKFIFEGFLPHKKGRQTRLQEMATYNKTFILYESPHRLLKTLEQLITYCGEERLACVSREITKMFEENFRGTLKDCLAHFSAKTIKGEIVITIAGNDKKFKSNVISNEEDDNENDDNS